MTVQQIIDSGQVNESTDSQTLHDALAMLAFQIEEIQKSQWGAMGQARITQHRRLIDRIQAMLNSRYGLDGMTPIAVAQVQPPITPIDFRTMVVDGHQLLLERIEEEGQWQVVITTFIEVLNSFSEWEPLASPQACWTFIETYPEVQAQLFLERAQHWWSRKDRRIQTFALPNPYDNAH